MTKKTLKGFIKTRHFIDRQKERKVTDKDVLRAIVHGAFHENHDGKNFILGDLKVTVDFAQEVLITVHPGGPKEQSRKILSKVEAKAIKELIEAQEAINRKDEDLEANDFLKYVQENSVKRLS